MKKWIRVLVSVFLLGSILCSSGVWAIQEPEIGIGSDTYDTFHREIEQKIKGIYCRYSSEAASIRAEMGGNVKARSVFSDGMQQDMQSLDQKMQIVQTNYEDEMKEMLESYGAVWIKDDSPALFSSDAGQMQTDSNVAYFSNTKEFCYIAAFYATTFLNDMWGDYDLVSMEMKDENGWSWNKISVTAYFNNYTMSDSTMTEMGEANQYHIVSGTLVSARTDFWIGCIFNVRDQPTGNAILGNTYGLSDLLLIGWLQTRGSSRVNYVRADFEHNYKWIVFSSVSVSGADIKNFNLNVTYSKESMRWSRTAGSKRVEIPAS